MWKDNFEKLEHLRSAISDLLIDKALQVCSALTNGKLFVSPTGRNTIRFEWQDENENYVELELYENGKIVADFMSEGDSSNAYEAEET